MAYIDLEDDFPKVQGFYKVKIKTTIGVDREAQTSWTERHGFSPINERVLSDEYIYCWWRD